MSDLKAKDFYLAGPMGVEDLEVVSEPMDFNEAASLIEQGYWSVFVTKEGKLVPQKLVNAWYKRSRKANKLTVRGL